MNKTPKIRNEHAASLRMRAGNAGTAIGVDTRPKTMRDRRKSNDRKRVRSALRSGICAE